ncbi:MAG TPA: 6-pyruvoyl-tetrahydropterin synthase-related protein [Blastocatellia bacterium]|nr:6-pyruvoyl-tetrahydropterin synthase-related protein [Blastocatellia bacterium]
MFGASKNKLETNAGSRPRARRAAVYAAALLAALMLGALAVAPYFFSHSASYAGQTSYQMVLTHDMTNHYFYMNQFQQSVRSGVLYPRWFADANNGYGIAVANYYPPGFYYTTTLVYAVFGDWAMTLFVLMALMMAGAGLALYKLARLFFSPVASAAAAALYMLMPYHLLDLYWRGALPEIFGFVFLPLVVYFVYKAGSRGAPRHIAGLGLMYGLHLLTHFPVGLMFSYALAFYVAAWALRARDWRILLRVGLGLGLGLAISSIYWLPAALETHLVFEYTQEIFPYHGSYIQPVPNNDPFNLTIIYSLKLTALLLIVVWLIYRRAPQTGGWAGDAIADTASSERRLQVSLWMMVCGACLFMTTAFSYDIGRWLPKLQLTVPPFRWLAIATMFGALLAAAAIERLRHGAAMSARRRLVLRIAFALVVALTLWVSFSNVIGAALKNPSFSPPQNYVESSMTPRDATRPEQLRDTAPVVITPQGGISNVITWQPEHRQVRVQLEQPSRVRLKTYNFPGWTARVDGERVPLGSDADGIQVVEVPAGQHVIDVRFQNTAPRWAGTVIALLGFIAIVGLALVRRAPADAPAATDQREPVSQSPASSVSQASAAQRVRYAVIAGGILIAVAIIITLTMRASRNQAPANRPAPEPRRTALTAGSDGVLYIDGQESVFVAVDEETLPQLLGAFAAKDNDKVDSFVRAGHVIRVANNTNVQLLEVAAGKVKVRITEGQNALQTGWVVDRWVR